MQKTVLALHDLSGFGRSSLVPIISIVSAAGHQCVPLPTAVFSTHTAIPGWVTTDLTNAMQPTVEQYDHLGLRFDAIYAGFLSSVQQIDGVQQAAERLHSDNALVLIDPVMGDNGRVYETYTPKMCARMGELCAIAGLITPNVTEAAILLGRAPSDAPHSDSEAMEWMGTLSARFDTAVVLTGMEYAPHEICTGCCDKTGGEIHRQLRIERYYPGTGDVFAATLLVRLLSGEPLRQAYRFAAGFTRTCIEHTAQQGGNPDYGVQFESCLAMLMEKE